MTDGENFHPLHWPVQGKDGTLNRYTIIHVKYLRITSDRYLPRLVPSPGQYSYVAPDGRTVTVTWTADEGGFSAESDDIPQLAPEHQAAIDGSVGGLPETYSQE